MLALGVQGVGSDDAPGQVQRLQQRREPGGLVGLAVHPDLAEHNTTAQIEALHHLCDVGYGEDASQIRTAADPGSWPPCATWPWAS